eukprot:gene16792-23069_t
MAEDVQPQQQAGDSQIDVQGVKPSETAPATEQGEVAAAEKSETQEQDIKAEKSTTENAPVELSPEPVTQPADEPVAPATEVAPEKQQPQEPDPIAEESNLEGSPVEPSPESVAESAGAPASEAAAEANDVKLEEREATAPLPEASEAPEGDIAEEPGAQPLASPPKTPEPPAKIVELENVPPPEPDAAIVTAEEIVTPLAVAPPPPGSSGGSTKGSRRASRAGSKLGTPQAITGMLPPVPLSAMGSRRFSNSTARQIGAVETLPQLPSQPGTTKPLGSTISPPPPDSTGRLPNINSHLNSNRPPKLITHPLPQGMRKQTSQGPSHLPSVGNRNRTMSDNSNERSGQKPNGWNLYGKSTARPKAQEKARRRKWKLEQRKRAEARAKIHDELLASEQARKVDEAQNKLETRKAAIRDRIQRQHDIAAKMNQDKQAAQERAANDAVRFKRKPLHERLLEEFEAAREREEAEKCATYAAEFAVNRLVRPHQIITGEEAEKRATYAAEVAVNRQEAEKRATYAAEVAVNRQVRPHQIITGEVVVKPAHMHTSPTRERNMNFDMHPNKNQTPGHQQRSATYEAGELAGSKEGGSPHGVPPGAKPRQQGMVLYSTRNAYQPTLQERAVSPFVFNLDNEPTNVPEQATFWPSQHEPQMVQIPESNAVEDDAQAPELPSPQEQADGPAGFNVDNTESLPEVETPAAEQPPAGALEGDNELSTGVEKPEQAEGDQSNKPEPGGANTEGGAEEAAEVVDPVPKEGAASSSEPEASNEAGGEVAAEGEPDASSAEPDARSAANTGEEEGTGEASGVSGTGQQGEATVDPQAESAVADPEAVQQDDLSAVQDQDGEVALAEKDKDAPHHEKSTAVNV